MGPTLGQVYWGDQLELMGDFCQALWEGIIGFHPGEGQAISSEFLLVGLALQGISEKNWTPLQFSLVSSSFCIILGVIFS